MRAQAKAQSGSPRQAAQASRGEPEEQKAVRDQAAEEAARRQEDLRAARAASSDLLGVSLSEERDEHWPAFLRDTAESLLKTLSSLARDETFWVELELAEQKLGRASPDYRGAVMEIMESDLTALLDLMGYAPPPSVEELGEEMQVALGDAMSEPDAALRGRLSRDARQRLLIYVYRLRELVTDVQEAEAGCPEDRRLRKRLTAAARVGARAIIPATVAAGGLAMMFADTSAGMAVAGGGAVLHLGMSAAAKEATKQGLLVASTSMMATMLAAQEGKAGPRALLNATELQVVRAAIEAVAVAEHLVEERPETVSKRLKAVVIEAMRWSFELEQVRSTQTRRKPFDAAERAGRAVADALADLRDWIQLAADYDGLADITARLKLAVEQLDAHPSASDAST